MQSRHSKSQRSTRAQASLANAPAIASVSLGAALAVALVPAAAQAEFTVKPTGRIDLYAQLGECIANSTGLCRADTVPGINDYNTTDTLARIDAEGQAEGFVEIEVFELIGTSEIGATTRIEFDADAKQTTDWDASAYLNDVWGELRIGTDIEGDQGAFDRDFHTAGPLVIAREVSGPKPSHIFNPQMLEEASVVYLSPEILGIAVAGELDANSNGMGSVRFQTGLFNGTADVALAMQNDGTIGGRLRVDRNAFSGALYGGRDNDGESYVAGGLGYTVGALRMTGEAGLIQTDSSAAEGKAREVQVLAAASYQIKRGVDVSGSLLWFAQEREDQTNPKHTLEGTRAAVRVRVTY